MRTGESQTLWNDVLDWYPIPSCFPTTPSPQESPSNSDRSKESVQKTIDRLLWEILQSWDRWFFWTQILLSSPYLFYRHFLNNLRLKEI